MNLEFYLCRTIIGTVSQLPTYATFLFANTDKVKSIHEGKQLESPCVCMTFEKDDMMKLPFWFSDYLDKSEDRQKGFCHHNQELGKR